MIFEPGARKAIFLFVCKEIKLATEGCCYFFLCAVSSWNKYAGKCSSAYIYRRISKTVGEWIVENRENELIFIFLSNGMPTGKKFGRKYVQ